MVHTKYFIEHASSFPDVLELPHGKKTSDRIRNRIFANLDVQNEIACLKLTRVPNAWGKQGWTYSNSTS